jgi:hypothetical protein
MPAAETKDDFGFMKEATKGSGGDPFDDIFAGMGNPTPTPVQPV